jgi:hypothetical protein
MIQVKYNGTHGNKMWEYAVARLYAETHGHAFYADAIDGLPNTAQIVDGIGRVGNVSHLRGHKFDFNVCNGDVIFDGFFQRYEYLKGNRQKLLNWFKSDIDSPCSVEEDDLVLSIRRGWNGYPTHLCPPSSFYTALIKKVNPRRIYLCTDSFDDQYFSFLKDFNDVVFFREIYLMQFDLIRKAKTLVLSPSTFCWWAAYLGNANKIFYPWYSDMIPTHHGGNWWVDDDSRYERVDV